MQIMNCLQLAAGISKFINTVQPQGADKKTKHRTKPRRNNNQNSCSTDTLGYPLKIMLSGGNVHDVSLAKELLSDMQAKAVLVDKAYNSRLHAACFG